MARNWDKWHWRVIVGGRNISEKFPGGADFVRGGTLKSKQPGKICNESQRGWTVFQAGDKKAKNPPGTKSKGQEDEKCFGCVSRLQRPDGNRVR
jgi:hypothetical protein